MPRSVLDAQTHNLGERFGWMKAHSCPCTYARGTPGSPNPNCNTCAGRGVWWEQPVDFTGLLTYMHTSAAPDEPGAATTDTGGHTIMGQPVLTIPNDCDSRIWTEASSFDAYVEYDARIRYDSVLALGEKCVLPYQWGVKIQRVDWYDTVNSRIVEVPAGQYTVSEGKITLTPASRYPTGTAITVEYFASLVLIAFRPAGGIPHTRPFAEGRGQIPKRFHIQTLDQWVRARYGGESPAYGAMPNVGSC